MRILFISHESKMYGAPKSMLYLIEDLRSRYNIEPIILTPTKGDLTIELEKRDIKYIVSKYYWWMDSVNNIKKIKPKLNKILNKILYKKVISRLKNYRFDLVHSNTSVCDIGYYIAKKYNLYHIWHIREYGLEDHGIEYTYKLDYVKKLYNDSDAIICVSDGVTKKYNNIIDNKDINTIHNGIKIDNTYKRKFKGDKNKTINFCIVGSLSESKNQLEAIKAAKILVDKGNKNFIIHIIGDGDKLYETKIIDYIKFNNLENHIKLYGYRNDIDNILDNMDVGIMTSKNEAFGRVTVEYMSKYMPVVGSNTGGTLEIIEDGVNGYLYNLNDIIDLTDKMELFIKNKELIKTLGENAYNCAVNKFNMEINTDKIYRIYREILYK